MLLRAHIARPDPTDKKRSILTIISQVDSRSQALPGWLGNILKDNGGAQNTEAMLKMLRELADARILDVDSDDDDDDNNEGAEGNASLDDFELLSVLGRGGFGKVMLVRHDASGGVYAMKILKKQELLRRRQVERTKTERHILEKATGHPFIVSLAYAFQTNAKLYMVMDFVQGGDFFTFLRKVGRMKESWAQLYVCEIALALQSLHDLDVVYRDLKPENVLLERDGHIKITDFGLSRSFQVSPRAPYTCAIHMRHSHAPYTRAIHMRPYICVNKGAGVFIGVFDRAERPANERRNTWNRTRCSLRRLFCPPLPSRRPTLFALLPPLFAHECGFRCMH